MNKGTVCVKAVLLFICIVTLVVLQCKYCVTIIEDRGEQMDTILAYIEETLHLNVSVREYDKANELPLYLRNGFDLSILSLLNVKCLLAHPKEQQNLTNLRKQANLLKKLTGLDSVLCLDDVRIYTKEKMLSEGIPFVITGKQIYMPFLGVALTSKGSREILQAEEMSFAAQRLILTAIYKGWQQTTLTEAASILNLSKMSVSRVFDELNSVGLDIIRANGKTRCFTWEGSRQALWDSVAPFLRNPVVRQYRLGTHIEIRGYKLGGMSALCHYSMLADDSYTVYAVAKDVAKTLELRKLPVIPVAETPAMVIQVMRYDLEYDDHVAVDPMTAILSLTNDEKNDPRVQAAIEGVLEECLRD